MPCDGFCPGGKEKSALAYSDKGDKISVDNVSMIYSHRKSHILAVQEMSLEEFSDSYPFMLSAGMQQRVGLARAYANDPDILLMDEPFGSLDAQTASRMRKLLLKVWSENRKTVVFITHDIDEAIRLGDRVVVFSSRPGRVKDSFNIDIPRPRADDLFSEPRYLELRRRLIECIQPDRPSV